MWLDYFIASKEEVLAFLEEIDRIINMKHFNVDVNFSFDYHRQENANSLDMLDYKVKDVIGEIKELTLNNYCQSVPDINRNDGIPYFVFYKDVMGMEFYIKIKIKNGKLIICKSFHKAKYSHREFPYIEGDQNE